MQPESTVANSLGWRIWHGANYLIGGICFIFGSVALYPSFPGHIDNASLSAWFYTIGSITFLLADITQWLHYTCPSRFFLLFSLNYFLSVIGSILYLVGSIAFIPQINLTALGTLLFIIGSAAVFLSQTWKEIRTLSQPWKSMRECYKQDVSGFHVNLFSGLGGMMYMYGTLLLDRGRVPGVIVYCLGGLFFTISGLVVQKRYFLTEEGRCHTVSPRDTQ